MSKLFSFRRTQSFPASTQELWQFIGDPENLKTITPTYMGFEITTPTNLGKMYPGQIIGYRVSPLAGIKMNWVTEITHVVDGSYFVDEQRFGPYQFWHHQHILEPLPNGVLMTDIVHYKIPLGFLGSLLNSVIVKKQLQEIFNYRKIKLEERFGTMP